MVAPLSFLLEVVGQTEAVGEIDSFDDALGRADDAAQKTTASTGKLYKGMSEAALGVTTAATGAFALYSQYDQLEKIELRIAQAEKSMDSAKRGVIESEQALQTLTAKGITSGADYESAVLRLSTAHQQLDIAEQKVHMSQQDLSQGHLSFALSILPTVTGAVSGAQSAMTALKTVQGLLAAGQVATNATQAAQIPILAGMTGATVTHTAATGSATLATRLLQLAMGPVGWIILGVSTFMALFATNAFGIRDAINAAGKAIGDAIPVMRPLLDLLGGLAKAIFPETKDATTDFADQSAGDLTAVQAEYDKLIAGGQRVESGITSSFSTASLQGGVAMDSLAENVDKNADRIVSDARRAEKAMGKLSDFGGPFGGQGSSDGGGRSSSSKGEGATFNLDLTLKLDGDALKRWIIRNIGDTAKIVG